MLIEGTIAKKGVEYFLQTSEGSYKIHISEQIRLRSDDLDFPVGMKAIGDEDAPDMQPPQNAIGWVKNGTLEILS